MEAITFIKEIMSIPSVNGRDDEGKVSEYLYAYLKSCGLRCELDRIDSLFSGGKRAMLPSFDLNKSYDIRFLCDYIYFTASDGKIPLYYLIPVSYKKAANCVLPDIACLSALGMVNAHFSLHNTF
mgnify:FL=1